MWEFVKTNILLSPYACWIIGIPAIAAIITTPFKLYKKYKIKKDEEKANIFTGLIGGVKKRK